VVKIKDYLVSCLKNFHVIVRFNGGVHNDKQSPVNRALAFDNGLISDLLW